MKKIAAIVLLVVLLLTGCAPGRDWENELDEQRMAYEDTIAGMHKQIESLKNQLDASDITLNDLAERYRELEKKYNDLQDDYDDLDEDYIAANKAARDYQEKYEDWWLYAKELEGILKQLGYFR